MANWLSTQQPGKILKTVPSFDDEKLASLVLLLRERGISDGDEMQRRRDLGEKYNGDAEAKKKVGRGLEGDEREAGESDGIGIYTCQNTSGSVQRI
ncbi:hypothetical protein SLA2020_445890 [Shorea laevis]